MLKSFDLRVSFKNSTVNGRRPDPQADARYRLNGWKHLGLSDSRVYTDGDAKQCGAYLHVPLIGDSEERWYRVRCWWTQGWGFELNGKFHKSYFRAREIVEQNVIRRFDRWYWIITIDTELRP